MNMYQYSKHLSKMSNLHVISLEIIIYYYDGNFGFVPKHIDRAILFYYILQHI